MTDGLCLLFWDYVLVPGKLNKVPGKLNKAQHHPTQFLFFYIYIFEPMSVTETRDGQDSFGQLQINLQL